MQPVPTAASATPLPRPKNAEFVPFGVGQHDPRLGALADISICRSKGNQSSDLCLLVLWPEVEVEPVLARLGLGDRNEEKPR
jgi:hypothetical protein